MGYIFHFPSLPSHRRARTYLGLRVKVLEFSYCMCHDGCFRRYSGCESTLSMRERRPSWARSGGGGGRGGGREGSGGGHLAQGFAAPRHTAAPRTPLGDEHTPRSSSQPQHQGRRRWTTFGSGCPRAHAGGDGRPRSTWGGEGGVPSDASSDGTRPSSYPYSIGRYYMSRYVYHPSHMYV